MRVLVFGAGGMLGQAVLAEFEKAHDAFGFRWPAVDGIDICDPGAVGEVMLGFAPDLVVNCAAYTDVDGAESHREEAWRVNAWGPWNVGSQIVRNGLENRVAVLHVSTDFVFDGTKGEPYTEYDAPNPVNVYLESNLSGVQALARTGVRHWIVRTQWLYGPNGRHFPGTILRLADQNKPLRVVDDQFGCPTSSVDLAAAMRRIVEECPFGVYHVNNDGETNWHEVARAVLELTGRDPDLVTAIPTDEYPTPATRPARSTLDRMSLRIQGQDRARPWRDALEEYLNTLSTNN